MKSTPTPLLNVPQALAFALIAVLTASWIVPHTYVLTWETPLGVAQNSSIIAVSTVRSKPDACFIIYIAVGQRCSGYVI